MLDTPKLDIMALPSPLSRYSVTATELPSTFRPRILGELEEAVMEVLWSTSAPLSVKEVQNRLERDLAYTTIMTILDRLFRKRLAEREKEGQAFLYTPAFTRIEFQQRLMAGLMGDMLPEAGAALLSTFVDLATEMDEANLERLEKLIATKKGERKA